jgi:hypothetical protein
VCLECGEPSTLQTVLCLTDRADSLCRLRAGEEAVCPTGAVFNYSKALFEKFAEEEKEPPLPEFEGQFISLRLIT